MFISASCLYSLLWGALNTEPSISSVAVENFIDQFCPVYVCVAGYNSTKSSHRFSPPLSVLKSESTDCPVYLQALFPAKDDPTMPEAVEETSGSTSGPNENMQYKGSELELEQMETRIADLDRSLDRSMDSSMESYENPFLKAPKRAKLKS